MDKKIVKVVYDNGEIKLIEKKNLKSREQIKDALIIGEKQDWRVERAYDRQFKELERDVLWGLDEDLVKEYAKDHLDLKDEDENDCDCHDKDVSDFEDDELMAELSRRNLLGYANVNIISIDLFTRFSRVITVADNQELETIISELEKKHNL
jgi:predicted DNA-binding antitoxin AbrB/MazE fold protein